MCLGKSGRGVCNLQYRSVFQSSSLIGWVRVGLGFIKGLIEVLLGQQHTYAYSCV